MALEVFWGSGSPFAWRVLLTLEVKGLPYQSRLLQFSKREHKTPEFLAMNPRGQVPVLRDGDYVVWESLAIMAYLERKHPAPPIFGDTPAAHGDIWRAVCELTSYLVEPAETYTLALFHGEADAQAPAVRAAVPQVRTELARLESLLSARDWLAGDGVTAADIVLLPTLKSLERAAGKPGADGFELALLPLAKHYPALARWVARMEALPGYDRTTPPHWR